MTAKIDTKEIGGAHSTGAARSGFRTNRGSRFWIGKETLAEMTTIHSQQPHRRPIARPVMLPTLAAGLIFLPAVAGVRADAAGAPPTVTTVTTAPTTAAAATKAAEDVPISYRIQTNDVLVIEVLNHPELQKQVQVLSDGTITYPYVNGNNPFNIKGKTLLELTNVIVNGLKKQLGNPRVLITVSQRDKKQVNIMGNGVKGNGIRPLGDDWHILNLIADVGGLSTDRPEFVTAKLIRHATVIPVDLKRVQAGDPDQNIALEPDDVLVVDMLDAAKTSVTVNGAVGKPGIYPVPRDGSILAVLTTDAGGFKPTASLASASIKKADGTIKEIDLRSIPLNGTVEAGVKLEPGDVLTIPEISLNYNVMGAVGKQGEIPYPDDKKVRLIDAIAAAGGTREDADLKKAILARPAADGTMTSRVIDIEKLMKNPGGTTASNTGSKNGAATVNDVNPLLQPGDVLVVPSKQKKSGFDFAKVLALIPMIGWMRGGF
jgi:protein involved in polysaccharide export with SLBB domain